MVPVEVIVRRLATGSFLKTHPQYKGARTPACFFSLSFLFLSFAKWAMLTM
jgi:phosphoribosylaminoimidazole-succinocarboxamide synthase